MVDSRRLLADLKRLHRSLQADLREQHAASPQRDAVQAEWRTAFDARRTADTFETFWSGAVDQAAVHWVLGVVFIRFLEDNRQLDRPLLSGPGERLDLAQERQRAYVRGQPLHTDTDYLLDIFTEAARLPGLAGLYDPTHNPLFRLPLSGDGAIALLAFFRDRVPETGELVHDFTDPAWNTRFLGDLYQDLSEEARKRYALLQTPEFVEEWILDRTLDPAMREFGATKVRMIDPACGSGHFLLGGFARLLVAWQREAPDMPPAAQAQRALDAVSGVDLNPFAVEIARFRLLLAALQAAEVTRLTAAPAFRFSVAVGDSLLHGRHFGQQRDFALEVNEGFRRTLRHHYAAENTGGLEALLGRQYHAVVDNPPYITPKDAAMRDAYREIYISCHMKYALAVPFIERFFDLAQTGTRGGQAAGYVGLIVANSFMKREFGKKLIEEVMPRLDLTHVVDCAGAYIPGHGTPTAILFGRNRHPMASVVRTVRGIRGEPATPDDPARGLVWSAIIAQADVEGSSSEFVSVEDTPRVALALHPWNMGGGGAAEVQAMIEEERRSLESLRPEIGFASFPGADDIFLAPQRAFLRAAIPSDFIRGIVIGDQVRDWGIWEGNSALVPYSTDFSLLPLAALGPAVRLLWPYRTTLAGIISFGGRTKADLGEPWWGWYRWIADRYRSPLSITFAEVASHNHFVLDRGGKVFKQTAPIIKLPAGASEEEYLWLLGLLNSSVACFWLKQVSHQKQMTGGDGIRVSSKSKVPFQFSGTRVSHFPLPERSDAPDLQVRLIQLAREADSIARGALSTTVNEVIGGALKRGDDIKNAWSELLRSRAADRSYLILLQEEMDFVCYALYGLVDPDGLLGETQNETALEAGQRPFSIIAQRNEDGFAVPDGVPTSWPEKIKHLWGRRISAIQGTPALQVIEEPNYKRRWIGRQGLFNHEARTDEFAAGLRGWLLDKLEVLHVWEPDNPRLLSTHALADSARPDADFLSVAALYASDMALNLEGLITELVTRESVPFLAPMRYSETGIRKRADWEVVWEKQRQEDRIDADVEQNERQKQRATWAQSHRRKDGETGQAYTARIQAALAEPERAATLQRVVERNARQRKQQEVGTVPVPPKYKQDDFLSADFWRLRGGLDVPKERFVSFPHCARDADGSLPVLWAGYDHLARAKAIAAWYVERKDTDGWPAPRLIPLLAGLLELVPWLRQWHNDDPTTGLRMGDYFAEFIDDECRSLGLNLANLREWKPPAPARRSRGRRAAA